MRGESVEIGRLREAAFKGELSDLEGEVYRRFGVDLSACYLDLELKNPVILAPGPLSQRVSQIERACRAGYGAIVLKSVVGEDEHGNASMSFLRRKPSFMKWYIDREVDPEGRYPTIHWNGGLDTRRFPEYLEFAEKAYDVGERFNVPLIASILCHLVSDPDEEWNVDEWIYTVERMCEIGYRYFEIDFCPFLKGERRAEDKETVLRWYREAPKIIREAPYDVKVIPKILNLDFGLDFQVEMVKAAFDGGSDGVTIANRLYRTFREGGSGRVYGSSHGGLELKRRNQEQIRELKRRSINIPISATGGVYTGRDIIEYLNLGSQNVQVLTYIMMSGFERALYNLLLDPRDGVVAVLIQE